MIIIITIIIIIIIMIIIIVIIIIIIIIIINRCGVKVLLFGVKSLVLRVIFSEYDVTFSIKNLM